MTAMLGSQLSLRTDPAFRRLLVWSAGLHLALGIALTVSPSGRGVLPAPRAVMVELLSAPAEAPARTPRRQVVDEPVVIPKRAKRTPKAKVEPVAPPALTAQQLIAKIRNEMPAEAAPSEAPAPADRSGRVDPLLAAYRSRVQALLRKNWSGARAFASQPALLARFEVEISAAGKLIAVARSSGSGNRYYDESAERAIWKAEPFPAPPRGELTLEINFRPGAVF